jgi:chromosome segregation ATPase
MKIQVMESNHTRIVDDLTSQLHETEKKNELLNNENINLQNELFQTKSRLEESETELIKWKSDMQSLKDELSEAILKSKETNEKAESVSKSEIAFLQSQLDKYKKRSEDLALSVEYMRSDAEVLREDLSQMTIRIQTSERNLVDSERKLLEEKEENQNLHKGFTSLNIKLQEHVLTEQKLTIELSNMNHTRELLEQELEKSHIETDELKGKLNVRESVIQEYSEQLNTTKENLETKTNVLIERELAIAALTSELNLLRDELAILQVSHMKVVGQTNETESLIQMHKSEIDELNEKIIKLKGFEDICEANKVEILVLTEKLNKQKDYESLIVSCKAELLVLREKVTRVTNLNTELEARKKELLQQLNVVTAELSILSSKPIDTELYENEKRLKIQLEESNNKIMILESNLNQFQNQMNGLREENEKILGNLNKKSRELDSANAEVKFLRTKNIQIQTKKLEYDASLEMHVTK